MSAESIQQYRDQVVAVAVRQAQLPSVIIAALRDEGATHIGPMGARGTYVAFRPAPGFPGMYGKAVVWPERDGGYHVEPWVLYDEPTVPAHALPL